MGNGLITFGLFLWAFIVLLTYIFLTSPEGKMSLRIKETLQIFPGQSTGLSLGALILRNTGLFWIVVGLIIKLIGESFIQGFSGDIFIGVVILAPVWLGAILSRKRKA